MFGPTFSVACLLDLSGILLRWRQLYTAQQLGGISPTESSSEFYPLLRFYPGSCVLRLSFIRFQAAIYTC